MGLVTVPAELQPVPAVVPVLVAHGIQLSDFVMIGGHLSQYHAVL